MSITRDISKKFTYASYVQLDSYVEFNSNTTINCPGTRICSNVPGYRQIIADGGDATGPYSLDATTFEVLKPGSWNLKSAGKVPAIPLTVNTEVNRGFPRSVYLPAVYSPSASKADSIALSKLYRKIKAEQEQLNSLASLAEIGDVIRQFGSPASALVDLTNKRLNRLELERRGLKGSIAFKRAKWHRIVASTWLEYSFGLAPLISDTKKVAEALARFNFADQLKSKAKTSARGQDEVSLTTISDTSTGLGSGNLRYRYSTKDVSQARCQYVVGLSASRTANLSANEQLLQLLGITPANLIPAAWEAVPWSWLIDYFSNVGAILDAGATSTANVTWICKTVIGKHTRESQQSLDVAATEARLNALGRRSLGMSGDSASYKSVRTILSRTKPASLGCPPLYLELPTKNKQLANMVAVLFARREKSSALWLF